MVDFDAALANGMAIEVTQAQIEPPPPGIAFIAPFDLASGTPERLVVVGFEGPGAADRSAADFQPACSPRTAIRAGSASPPWAMPTNNTGRRSAAYSPSDQRLPPPPAPGGAPRTRTRCSC